MPPKAAKLFTLSLKRVNFWLRKAKGGQEKFPLIFPPHSPPRPKDFVPPQGLEKLLPPPPRFFLNPPVAPTHGHLCTLSLLMLDILYDIPVSYIVQFQSAKIFSKVTYDICIVLNIYGQQSDNYLKLHFTFLPGAGPTAPAPTSSSCSPPPSTPPPAPGGGSGGG